MDTFDNPTGRWAEAIPDIARGARNALLGCGCVSFFAGAFVVLLILGILRLCK